MISVQIGNETRDVSEIDQQWLCNAINGRRHDGLPVQIRVIVHEGLLHMELSNPSLPGAGRRPNPSEAEVFELWRRLHLNEPDFSCGNLNAFLVQLRRLI